MDVEWVATVLLLAVCGMGCEGQFVRYAEMSGKIPAGFSTPWEGTHDIRGSCENACQMQQCCLGYFYNDATKDCKMTSARYFPRTCDADASGYEYYLLSTPVNGGWSYGDWTECSASCGSGLRMRTRVCNNPPPAFGGAACDGCTLEIQDCNPQSCVPASCPTGSFLHPESSTCFQGSGSTAKWKPDAQSTCESLGGRLAVLDTTSKADFIMGLVRGGQLTFPGLTSVYLGASYVNGKWEWLNGVEVYWKYLKTAGYTVASEPDNLATQKDVSMYYYNGWFIGNGGSGARAYLCEFPPTY